MDFKYLNRKEETTYEFEDIINLINHTFNDEIADLLGCDVIAEENVLCPGQINITVSPIYLKGADHVMTIQPTEYKGNYVRSVVMNNIRYSIPEATGLFIEELFGYVINISKDFMKDYKAIVDYLGVFLKAVRKDAPFERVVDIINNLKYFELFKDVRSDILFDVLGEKGKDAYYGFYAPINSFKDDTDEYMWIHRHFSDVASYMFFATDEEKYLRFLYTQYCIDWIKDENNMFDAYNNLPVCFEEWCNNEWDEYDVLEVM